MKNDVVSEQELMLQLKEMVINICNLKNCRPEDISESATIIGGEGKLRLDSMDAVEIVMAIERNYGIRVENPGDVRKILKSFVTLQDFILRSSK